MSQQYNKYMCLNCEFVYDEAEGMPEYDIPPGTRWEELDEDWICPVCGSEKVDFELVEE